MTAPLRLLCVISLTLLAACADETKVVTRLTPITVEIDPRLRTCPEAPVVPGEGATQKDVGEYIVGLHSAHGVCKTNLDTVDQILTDYEAMLESRVSGAAEQ